MSVADRPGGGLGLPHIIAHRGASASAPENTLAAFVTAIELGADFIETDIHVTRSGELVCIHDDNVDRTTDGAGPVRALGLDALKRLDAGSWFYGQSLEIVWRQSQLSVPTLRELIDVSRDTTGLCIEIKQPELYPGIEQRLLETLRDARQRLIIQSFDPGSLRKMAALASQLAYCRLLAPGAECPDGDLDEIGEYARGIGPCWTDVTQDLVDRAHSRGMFVNTYTVNSPDDMRALIAMGVDGIISDNCVELKRVIRERVRPGRPQQ